MFQNYSKYLYLPENVLLYGDHEEGTDKITFLEARFRDANFKLLHKSCNNFVPTEGSYIFSSISPLYVFLWSNTMSDSSSHKNLT